MLPLRLLPGMPFYAIRSVSSWWNLSERMRWHQDSFLTKGAFGGRLCYR